MADLQYTKDLLCSECCSCWAGRSLPATVADSFPLLAGVSGGVKACVAALVRYVGSGHDMAMFELSHSLFLGRFFAGGVLVVRIDLSVFYLACQLMKVLGAGH